MAQLYHRRGIVERAAQFDYSFRSNPDYGTHQAGFSVMVGHGPLLAWMQATRFDDATLEDLAGLHDPTGRPRFDQDFLDWLAGVDLAGSLRLTGLAEGRVGHPNVPLITVEGPLAAAQLLETPLLNICNYPSLIATKAARVVRVAQGSAVLEFGMRRGPGTGVTEAIRGALVAGCTSTSDVEAALGLGVDPAGTHAHSMVQAFMALGGGELEAFRAFAELYPDACLLLIDTIDTLRSGLPNAITVFRELREQGHEGRGIRLDSGDLAYLAVRCAVALDEAGFPEVSIVFSGDLDELTIWQILTQIGEEAPRFGVDPERIRRRLVYGVGTRLITSDGAPSFSSVYKLVALADEHGEMQPAVKLSENPAKIDRAASRSGASTTVTTWRRSTW
ncbi:MAG: nicotinate phosphoribosyltransferase [Ilumatobacteraceae bacterium]